MATPSTCSGLELLSLLLLLLPLPELPLLLLALAPPALALHRDCKTTRPESAVAWSATSQCLRSQPCRAACAAFRARWRSAMHARLADLRRLSGETDHFCCTTTDTSSHLVPGRSRLPQHDAAPRLLQIVQSHAAWLPRACAACFCFVPCALPEATAGANSTGPPQPVANFCRPVLRQFNAPDVDARVRV